MTRRDYSPFVWLAGLALGGYAWYHLYPTSYWPWEHAWIWAIWLGGWLVGIASAPSRSTAPAAPAQTLTDEGTSNLSIGEDRPTIRVRYAASNKPKAYR